MIHPLSYEISIGRAIAGLVAILIAAATVAWLLRGRPGLALLDAALAAGTAWLALRRRTKETD